MCAPEPGDARPGAPRGALSFRHLPASEARHALGVKSLSERRERRTEPSKKICTENQPFLKTERFNEDYPSRGGPSLPLFLKLHAALRCVAPRRVGVLPVRRKPATLSP